MKTFLLLMLIPLFLYAGENYNGFKDTSSISGVLVDGTKKYTTAFDLSPGHDFWIIAMVNDTSEDGFASDSINFEWGIQVGNWCLDTGEAADTCWEAHTPVDTIAQDSLGVSNNYTFANGAITRTKGGVDTLSVGGYAYQMVKIDLDDIWGCFIRGWVNSLGDPSKDGYGLDIRFHFMQRRQLK